MFSMRYLDKRPLTLTIETSTKFRLENVGIYMLRVHVFLFRIVLFSNCLLVFVKQYCACSWTFSKNFTLLWTDLAIPRWFKFIASVQKNFIWFRYEILFLLIIFTIFVRVFINVDMWSKTNNHSTIFVSIVSVFIQTFDQSYQFWNPIKINTVFIFLFDFEKFQN